MGHYVIAFQVIATYPLTIVEEAEIEELVHSPAGENIVLNTEDIM